MSYYVYLSEQCNKDIAKQHYDRIIDKFQEKLEQTQSIEVFDRFPPPFLKKRFERQIRLVAKEFFAGDHSVIVFLRLFVRGGQEYATFGERDYKVIPGVDFESDEFTPENLQNYLDSRSIPVPPPPPGPTKQESQFLYSVLANTPNTYRSQHCCETKSWVDAISKTVFQDRLHCFVEPIFDTLDSQEEGLAQIRSENFPDFGIVYRRVPARNMTILFAPFEGEAPIEEIRKAYPELSEGNVDSHASVIRRTKRAYPFDLLLNDSAWFSVQKDREGSLALSEEEIEVLESARSPAGGYPLFINGRAGSGKSTILQYLFSEYLYYHINNEIEGVSTPVFFATNNELLSRSSASIRGLLKALAKNASQTELIERIENNWAEIANGAFRNFHDWLHSLIPSGHFPPDKLIEYGNFKYWWEEKFSKDRSARKLYDADLSWHIIRTYIKGIGSEEYLDPEDYLELPSKQKSVTAESYQIVYEKVWARFHEDQRNIGLWDHQDLTRYALSNDLITTQHPVVYCDESQDFTRIELEVLHRLNLFNNRTLTSQDQSKVPLAFAGDPFQTLNPTGFRWEGTKALFTEKFIKAYPGEKTREINYKELSYNYRSSRPIVKFCNTLQLLRSVAFRFPEIRPQQTWDDDADSPSVHYFERGNLDVLNTLKNQSEIRIIVPCDDGEEEKWTRQNGLSDFVKFDEAGVPKNVVSASRVKGLEFSRVVLFGFAGACPNSLKQALEHPDTPLDGDQAIEPQYFLNRLYVAASRPRRRLFIVDSSEDIQNFWNKIFTNLDDYILRSKHIEEWDGACGQIIKGTLKSWEGDTEDAFETAEKLFREGKLRKDSVLLRQAAQSFNSTGNNKKRTLEAKAEALELESNWLEAAKLWLKNENHKRAISAAWQARVNGYKYIIDLGDKVPDLKERIEYKISTFLSYEDETRDDLLGEGVTLLKEIVDTFSDDSSREEMLTKPSWTDAIIDCLNKIQNSKEAGFGLWDVAYNNALSIERIGIRTPGAILGTYAYNANKLKFAYEHWNSLDQEEIQKFQHEFLRAKGESLDYPMNLEAYGELLQKTTDPRDAERILSLAHQEGMEQLESGQMEYIVHANSVLGNTQKLVENLEHIDDANTIASMFLDFAENNQLDEFRKSFSRFLQIITDDDDWSVLVDLIQGHQPKFDNSDRHKVILPQSFKNFRKSHAFMLEGQILKFIAGNEDFDNARNNIKTKLATLINDKFTNNFNWIDEIHPIIVGLALEKAGMFKFTLPFYEHVICHSRISEKCKLLGQQRWARTKFLQANRDFDSNQKGRAEKNLNEAHDMAKKAGFSSLTSIPDTIYDLEGLPDFFQEKEAEYNKDPETATTEAPQPRADTSRIQKPENVNKDYTRSCEFENCLIKVSKDGSRVNLEHQLTLEQASILIKEKSVNFESEKLHPNEEQIVPLEDWSIDISFERLHKGLLDVEASDGASISLPVFKPM